MTPKILGVLLMRRGSVVKCNVWMGIVFKSVGGSEGEGRFVCGDLHSICF